MAGKKYGVIQFPLSAGHLDYSACTGEQMHVLTCARVVYLYYGKRSFYVGQTDCFLTRHKQHLQEVKTDYRQFERVLVLFGQYVDGNSQNDLEHLLISYLTADQENLPAKERRVCQNKTQGNRFVDYQSREEVLSLVLTPFWENELCKAGVVHQKSLDALRTSILFKYSPFTELSAEQFDFIQEVEESGRSFLIEGTAGNGKTVVLTNLAALLFENPSRYIGLVVKSNFVQIHRRGGKIQLGQDRPQNFPRLRSWEKHRNWNRLSVNPAEEEVSCPSGGRGPSASLELSEAEPFDNRNLRSGRPEEERALPAGRTVGSACAVL